MSDRLIAVIFIFIAILLITAGRYHARKARRNPPPRFYRRAVAWTLLAIGLIFMMLGVLTW